MKPTNFFLGILLTFFSPKFYREAAANWRGKAFLALFTALFLFWLLLTTISGFQITSKAKSLVNYIAPQLPTMTIKNGTISTDTTAPTKIYLPHSKTPLAIIDTHNQLKNITQIASFAYIGPRTVRIKKPNKIDTYKVPKKYNMVLTSKNFAPLVSKILVTAIPITFFIMAMIALVVTYAMAVLGSLILAMINLIIGKISKREIYFSSAYSLALLACIPAFGLNLILHFFEIRSTWLYLLFALLYSVYAVYALPKNEIKENTSAE